MIRVGLWAERAAHATPTERDFSAPFFRLRRVERRRRPRSSTCTRQAGRQAGRQHAAHLFDEMAERSKALTRQRTTDGNKEDPLSALPVDLLHHILSFMPSLDLVRSTCMIARPWRYRWKSVPVLRISKDNFFQTSDEMSKFMNYLIALRGHNPLVECEIKFWHEEETFSYIDLWVRYASVLCNVQILRIINLIEYCYYCPLPDVLLVSDHLTTLELRQVELAKPSLDFSSCSALHDLKITFSDLRVTEILSPSVKKLTIQYCDFIENVRTRISVPSLSILDLVVDWSLIPLLDDMPQLVSASITHETDSHYCDSSSDYCCNRFEIGGCADASCPGCTHNMGQGKKSVLLEVLSRATHLKLLAYEVEMFIFRRDLTLGPVFVKLKTLVVDDWCMVANSNALIFFLQHSPALEKLTLLIFEDEGYEVAKKAKYEGTKQSSMSFKQLTVEVKCKGISEKVKQILKMLVTCGVPPGQIKIDFRLTARCTMRYRRHLCTG